MQRVFVPTWGYSHWRGLLSDPDRHWKRGRSAMELAVSWEAAQRTERGLPAQVARALDQVSDLTGCQLLLALPEHRVQLKGPGRASQTDLWALMRTGNRYISMAVEGKAGEPFGPTLSEWEKVASDRTRDRINSICDVLQISTAPPECRYQLLHRTASAILEARRFAAPFAVMLVQSFTQPIARAAEPFWEDFKAFCALLGASAKRGGLAEARYHGIERLFLGWTDCSPGTDHDIANAL